MMINITVLMCTVSLDLQLPACVIIHNQCLNTKLVSPIYFGNGAVCPKLSDQQIDIDAKMNASFEIYATQDDFESALLYKLQRYSKPNIQSDTNTLTTETNENKAKCVQIFIAWKMKESKPFIYAVLVEHIKEFIWNEDELRKLYDRSCGWLKEYDSTISDTWFIDDNMILETSFKVRGSKGNFELSIFIAEEEENYYAMRPLCINPKR
jgi:hypothetical protein